MELLRAGAARRPRVPYDADDLIERVAEEALPEEQPPEPVVNQDRRDNVRAQTPVPQYDP